MAEFEMIAKTFLGLEEVLAQELTELGANNIAIGNRMVSFTGDKALMYRANFHLRTAIRILKPFKHFKASDADEVYDICKKQIRWEELMSVSTSFSVDAVVNSEEFKHSKFVAYRVKDAIADYFREKEGHRPNVSVANPDIMFHIHISNEDCSLSLDSSGESLHMRGYRQETMEAPLNEVLAAGMLLLAGWHGQCDFVDPMCGSGTLPIEAALIAKNMAPGLFRSRFAFEKWNDFDSELFAGIYNDDSAERPFNGRICGFDKDARAILTAKRNAKAAGLLDTIQFEARELKDFQPVGRRTLMVTNPPYGERLKEGDVPAVYETLGERLKHAFMGSEAWVICNHFEYFDKIGLKASAKIPLYNGALACEFRKYEIFGGRYDSFRSSGESLKKEDSATRRGTTLRHKAAQAEKEKMKDAEGAAVQEKPRRPYRRHEDGEEGHRPYRRRQEGDSNDRPRRSFRKSEDGEKPRRPSPRPSAGPSSTRGGSARRQTEGKPFGKSRPSGNGKYSGSDRSYGKGKPAAGRKNSERKSNKENR